MKDIRLKVRAYNNRLVTLREALGFQSAAAFARAASLPYVPYSELERLKLPVFHPKRGWRPLAKRVAEFHGCLPEDIWPGNLQYAQLDKVVELTIDAMELPAAIAEGHELFGIIAHAFNAVLMPREATVLRWLYGLDGREPLTFGEIGSRLGITEQRVKQIRDRALQRLRRPDQLACRQLKDYRDAQGLLPSMIS